MKHRYTVDSYWRIEVNEYDKIIHAEFYTKDPLCETPYEWIEPYWWKSKKSLKKFLDCTDDTKVFELTEKELFMELL